MEIYTEVVKLETAEVIRPQETQALTNVLINTCISSPTIELCSTPKKRKYMEPRYISELMTSDVNTPRKARRIIKFIKANDLKRRERIQNLQRMNRNLLKRIENLENMIEHLKGKLLMSEDAADVLLL
ncbi:PREDICTED: uncharacterized protein LOC108781949 [Cyphomyrmex costatus]|uniref:uncharacterized protein LOC108781949 n=1 Tax=Cyphomyrmex costatus TaxID=456900 RepID=UPI000852380B|nr:PREDICTED: uncharacterized protein LOC108781949 [Cyphomyrmex costatus]